MRIAINLIGLVFVLQGLQSVRAGSVYGSQLVSLPGGQQALVRCATPQQSMVQLPQQTMMQLAPQSMMQLSGQPMMQLGGQSMIQLGGQSMIQLGGQSMMQLGGQPVMGLSAPVQQYMQMQVPMSTASGATVYQTVQIPVQMQPQQQQVRPLLLYNPSFI